MRSFVFLLLIGVACARLLGGNILTVCTGDRIDGRRLTLPKLRPNHCNSGYTTCQFSNDPHQLFNGRFLNEPQKRGFNWAAYYMDGKQPVRVQLYFAGGRNLRLRSRTGHPRGWTTTYGMAVHLPNGNYFKVMAGKPFINCKPVHPRALGKFGIRARGRTYTIQIGNTRIIHTYGLARIIAKGCRMAKAHGWCAALWKRTFQTCAQALTGPNPAYVKTRYNYFACKNHVDWLRKQQQQRLQFLKLKKKREQERINKLNAQKVKRFKQKQIELLRKIELLKIAIRIKKQKERMRAKIHQIKCSRRTNRFNRRKCLRALARYSSRKCPKREIVNMCTADLCINKGKFTAGLLRVAQRNYLVRYQNKDCKKAIRPPRRCRRSVKRLRRTCARALRKYDGVRCNKLPAYRYCMKVGCRRRGFIRATIRFYRRQHRRRFRRVCNKPERMRLYIKNTKREIRELKRVSHLRLRKFKRIVDIHRRKHIRALRRHRRLMKINNRRFNNKLRRIKAKYTREIRAMKREIKNLKESQQQSDDNQNPITIHIDNSNRRNHKRKVMFHRIHKLKLGRRITHHFIHVYHTYTRLLRR